MTRHGGSPLLSGIVIHWRNEDLLARLLEAWPADPRFELVVIDNSSSLSEPLLDTVAGTRLLQPGRNLGFAGAANLGLRETSSPTVLLLNPDAVPAAGALEAILEGLRRNPRCAGLAPRLLGDDGASQFRWQLRPLPSPWTLLAQALLLPVGGGPRKEPVSGTAVEQPAAAALALRREALEAAGGLDEGFYPAWFEDVDLARRLAEAGETLIYWPAARFRHGLGGSVPKLGYGPFLWVYDRNLMRYLGKHHGRIWRWSAAPALVAGALARIALLPLRKPSRAASRGEALRGLVAVIAGVLSGWRLPRSLARRFQPPKTAAGSSLG
jgi:N-acetylglucosaminyl-diphospho-decaprenol L-rhamnosyltransferase